MELGEADDQPKTWLGSSISDLCENKEPWCFHVTPVIVSKYHSVLYESPVTLKEPPNPHFNLYSQCWDDDHVRMPYSEKNVFPVRENGIDVLKLRWNIIKDSLKKRIRSSQDLEAAIMTYNNNLPKFLALHMFFEEVMEEDETDIFFTHLLPKIIDLALQLPNIVPSRLPLMKKNYNRSVSLSQLQVACLLANAFLCTFPWRKDVASSYPGVNFIKLFIAHSKPDRHNSIAEKFKCIFHYFRRVTSSNPVGVITFERKFIHKSNMPRWDELDSNLGMTKIHINSLGTIEDDGLGFLQVDFANKNVGGGVLGYGCVQEEIRFIICPELIIGRLFIEQLGDHEAVIVTGPERYSKYLGYGNSFQWDGDFIDKTPHDEYGRRKTTICIIDATHFQKHSSQFYPSAMLRELNKAYVGFSSSEKDNLSPVATGNWGCGAFQGDSTLKALLQLMACNASKRHLVYYSFGDEDLKNNFHKMYTFLAIYGIKINQLWHFLGRFSLSGLSHDNLYSYIQQAYFDSKKQPTLKFFLGGSHMKKTEDPSTSLTDRKSYNSSGDKSTGSSDVLEDAILSSTCKEIQFKKKTPNVVKSKLTSTEVMQRLPKTNIAELIDIIDGNIYKPKEISANQTLLTEIDKLPKKIKRDNVANTQISISSEEDNKMDVDTEVAPSNLIEESKSSKRKISDYFQIKSKSS